MEKTWDNSLSLLVNSHPQAFVDLLLPGAMCLQNHRTKLSGTQRQPDAVLEVIRYDELFMFNPEFQSAYDGRMAERSLLYHVLVSHQHSRNKRPLPVRSCVVLLWERAKMASSPLRLMRPGEPSGEKHERICFSYETVEMWEKRPEDILDLGHMALYPLLPLTNGGASRQMVTHMFELLSGSQNRNYAIIGYAIATHTLEMSEKFDDLKWLEERFSHMDDDILIGSPVYRWIIERGHAQDLAQMRQAVVDFVQGDFPELVQLAEEVVATIDNPAQLVRLTAKLGGAQDAEQARKVLSALVQ